MEPKVMRDPIVEELHAVRREHAAKFTFDLRAIAADLARRRDDSRFTYMELPPKRAEAPAAGPRSPA